MQAVEAVALLDMLTGFAELVLSEEGYWTRPTLNPDVDAALAIKAGRHPVVEKHVASFTPNNAFASRFANVVLVSGANGAGKTIYVKGIAQLCVLSQIGSFVPCESASLPIFDRLLTSVGTGDDMETNLSTFMAEMRRAAYIIDHLTPRSLVIIDELGRGTATSDGSSLSYAVAEALLPHQAITFFVSHYRQLLPLSRAYANVQQVGR
jgi:DNA mismatch repair ATPase MutS